MLEEEFAPLLPVSFFDLEVGCQKLLAKEKLKSPKFKLPSTSLYTLEESFADLYLAWSEEGLYLFCEVKTPFKDLFYPEITRGDSLELFIDTRNLKSESFNSKFCHHFFFLPKEIEGVQKGEITKFRGENFHPLAQEDTLSLHTEFHKTGFNYNIFLPRDCLHGYDPEQNQEIGFNYRVNRSGGFAQHFSASGDEFAIKDRPATLATVVLQDENTPLRKPASKKR